MSVSSEQSGLRVDVGARLNLERIKPEAIRGRADKQQWLELYELSRLTDLMLSCALALYITDLAVAPYSFVLPGLA